MEMYQSSVSLGNETSQMWTLNKRLEAYLSRVKALEEENELLRAEIHHLRAKSDTPSVRKYHQEIMKLRDALDDGHQRMAEVEMDRENLCQEIELVTELCLQEQRAQQEAKRELSQSKKLLEEEKQAQVWLKGKLVQLEEEMEDLLRVHEEEKAAMEEEMSSLAQRLVDSSFKVAPVSFQPVNVQDYAAQFTEIWQRAVDEYKSEVSALEDSLSEANENLRKVLDENKQSRLHLQDLERELLSLKTRKEMLEGMLDKQWQDHQEEEGQLQMEMEALEKEKQELRAQIARVLEDRQQLMHLKMSLSLEVATYRSLLEAESTRIYSPTADYPSPSHFGDLELEKGTLRKRRTESTKTPSRDYRTTPTKRQIAEKSDLLAHTPSRFQNVKNTSSSKRASPVTKEFQKVSSVLQSQSVRNTKAPTEKAVMVPSKALRPETENVFRKSKVETVSKSYPQGPSKAVTNDTVKLETKVQPLKKVIVSEKEVEVQITPSVGIVDNGYLLPGEIVHSLESSSEIRKPAGHDVEEASLKVHMEVQETVQTNEEEETERIIDREEVVREVVSCQRVFLEKEEVVQLHEYQNMGANVEEHKEELYTSSMKEQIDEQDNLNTVFSSELLAADSKSKQENVIGLGERFEDDFDLGHAISPNSIVTKQLAEEKDDLQEDEVIVNQQSQELNTLQERNNQQFPNEEDTSKSQEKQRPVEPSDGLQAFEELTDSQDECLQVNEEPKEIKLSERKLDNQILEQSFESKRQKNQIIYVTEEITEQFSVDDVTQIENGHSDVDQLSENKAELNEGSQLESLNLSELDSPAETSTELTDKITDSTTEEDTTTSNEFTPDDNVLETIMEIHTEQALDELEDVTQVESKDGVQQENKEEEAVPSTENETIQESYQKFSLGEVVPDDSSLCNAEATSTTHYESTEEYVSKVIHQAHLETISKNIELVEEEGEKELKAYEEFETSSRVEPNTFVEKEDKGYEEFETLSSVGPKITSHEENEEQFVEGIKEDISEESEFYSSVADHVSVSTEIQSESCVENDKDGQLSQDLDRAEKIDVGQAVTEEEITSYHESKEQHFVERIEEEISGEQYEVQSSFQLESEPKTYLESNDWQVSKEEDYSTIEEIKETISLVQYEPDECHINVTETSIESESFPVLKTEVESSTSEVYEQEVEHNVDHFDDAVAKSSDQPETEETVFKHSHEEEAVDETNIDVDFTEDNYSKSEEDKTASLIQEEPEGDQKIAFSLNIIQSNLRFTTDNDSEIQFEIPKPEISEVSTEQVEIFGDLPDDEKSTELDSLSFSHPIKEDIISEDVSKCEEEEHTEENVVRFNLLSSFTFAHPLIENITSEDKDGIENKDEQEHISGLPSSHSIMEDKGITENKGEEEQFEEGEQYLEPEARKQVEEHPDDAPRAESENFSTEQNIFTEKPSETLDSVEPTEHLSDIEDDTSRSDESLDSQGISLFSQRSEDFEISKDYQLEQTLPDSTPLPNLDEEFEDLVEDQVMITSEQAQNAEGLQLSSEHQDKVVSTKKLEPQLSQEVIEAILSEVNESMRKDEDLYDEFEDLEEDDDMITSEQAQNVEGLPPKIKDGDMFQDNLSSQTATEAILSEASQIETEGDHLDEEFEDLAEDKLITPAHAHHIEGSPSYSKDDVVLDDNLVSQPAIEAFESEVDQPRTKEDTLDEEFEDLLEDQITITLEQATKAEGLASESTDDVVLDDDLEFKSSQTALESISRKVDLPEIENDHLDEEFEVSEAKDGGNLDEFEQDPEALENDTFASSTEPTFDSQNHLEDQTTSLKEPLTGIENIPQKSDEIEDVTPLPSFSDDLQEELLDSQTKQQESENTEVAVESSKALSHTTEVLTTNEEDNADLKQDDSIPQDKDDSLETEEQKCVKDESGLVDFMVEQLETAAEVCKDDYNKDFVQYGNNENITDLQHEILMKTSEDHELNEVEDEVQDAVTEADANFIKHPSEERVHFESDYSASSEEASPNVSYSHVPEAEESKSDVILESFPDDKVTDGSQEFKTAELERVEFKETHEDEAGLTVESGQETAEIEEGQLKETPEDEVLTTEDGQKTAELERDEEPNEDEAVLTTEGQETVELKEVHDDEATLTKEAGQEPTKLESIEIKEAQEDEPVLTTDQEKETTELEGDAVKETHEDKTVLTTKEGQEIVELETKTLEEEVVLTTEEGQKPSELEGDEVRETLEDEAALITEEGQDQETSEFETEGLKQTNYDEVLTMEEETADVESVDLKETCQALLTTEELEGVELKEAYAAEALPATEEVKELGVELKETHEHEALLATELGEELVDFMVEQLETAEATEEVKELEGVELKEEYEDVAPPATEEIKELEGVELKETHEDEALLTTEEVKELGGIELKETHEDDTLLAAEKDKELESVESKEEYEDVAPPATEEIKELEGVELKETHEHKALLTKEEDNEFGSVELKEEYEDEAPPATEEIKELEGVELKETHEDEALLTAELGEELVDFMVEQLETAEATEEIKELEGEELKETHEDDTQMTQEEVKELEGIELKETHDDEALLTAEEVKEVDGVELKETHEHGALMTTEDKELESVESKEEYEDEEVKELEGVELKEEYEHEALLTTEEDTELESVELKEEYEAPPATEEIKELGVELKETHDDEALLATALGEELKETYDDKALLATEEVKVLEGVELKETHEDEALLTREEVKDLEGIKLKETHENDTQMTPEEVKELEGEELKETHDDEALLTAEEIKEVDGVELKETHEDGALMTAEEVKDLEGVELKETCEDEALLTTEEDKELEGLESKETHEDDALSATEEVKELECVESKETHEDEAAPAAEEDNELEKELTGTLEDEALLTTKECQETDELERVELKEDEALMVTKEVKELGVEFRETHEDEALLTTEVKETDEFESVALKETHEDEATLATEEVKALEGAELKETHGDKALLTTEEVEELEDVVLKETIKDEALSATEEELENVELKDEAPLTTEDVKALEDVELRGTHGDEALLAPEEVHETAELEREEFKESHEDEAVPNVREGQEAVELGRETHEDGATVATEEVKALEDAELKETHGDKVLLTTEEVEELEDVEFKETIEDEALSATEEDHESENVELKDETLLTTEDVELRGTHEDEALLAPGEVHETDELEREEFKESHEDEAVPNIREGQEAVELGAETQEDEAVRITTFTKHVQFQMSDEDQNDSSFDSNSGNEQETTEQQYLESTENHINIKAVNGHHEHTIVQATLDFEDSWLNGHSALGEGKIVISETKTIVKLDEDIIDTHTQDFLDESVLQFAASEGKSEGLFQSLLENSENKEDVESSEFQKTLHAAFEYMDSAAEEGSFSKKILNPYLGDFNNQPELKSSLHEDVQETVETHQGFKEETQNLVSPDE